MILYMLTRILISISSALVLVGCGSSTTPSTTPLAAAAYVGTWNGTWKDTTFTTQGTAKAVITQTGTPPSASNIVFTLTNGTGMVFASTPPANDPFEAVITTTLATLTPKTDSFYGTLTGTLNGDGVIALTATSVPGGCIASYGITGTWTATTLTGAIAMVANSPGPCTPPGGGTAVVAALSLTKAR